MKFKWLTYMVLAAAFATGGTLPADAAGRPWEVLRSERSDSRVVARDGDVEIRTARSTIIVTVTKTTAIKVYTILGQLVSSETLSAGTYQLHIPAHGVFIVKTGTLTCKVAL